MNMRHTRYSKCCVENIKIIISRMHYIKHAFGDLYKLHINEVSSVQTVHARHVRKITKLINTCIQFTQQSTYAATQKCIKLIKDMIAQHPRSDHELYQRITNLIWRIHVSQLAHGKRDFHFKLSWVSTAWWFEIYGSVFLAVSLMGSIRYPI